MLLNYNVKFVTALKSWSYPLVSYYDFNRLVARPAVKSCENKIGSRKGSYGNLKAKEVGMIG